MKAHFLKLHAFLIAAVVAVGCGDSGNKTAQSIVDSTVQKVDTAMSRVKEGAEKVADDVKAEMHTNADSDFVVKAALANSTEEKVLQAGINKGTDKDLKAHTRMMLADHKKLGAKVKAYAAGKGYILPVDDNGKGDDAISTLDKNSKGKDWDKALTDHLVSAHQDAIAMFEKGQSDVKDADLKAIIDGALPTLHSHLDMMKQLQDKLAK
jgi:putative membrane protein